MLYIIGNDIRFLGTQHELSIDNLSIFIFMDNGESGTPDKVFSINISRKERIYRIVSGGYAGALVSTRQDTSRGYWKILSRFRILER
jgi:hypothetical protein